VPVRDRQTDRQTNSAENNGPSGLQSDQKFGREGPAFRISELKQYFIWCCIPWLILRCWRGHWPASMRLWTCIYCQTRHVKLSL